MCVKEMPFISNTHIISHVRGIPEQVIQSSITFLINNSWKWGRSVILLFFPDEIFDVEQALCDVTTYMCVRHLY